MDIFYSDKQHGILKEITANSVCVPFGNNLGPSFYYKDNGKQIPIELNLFDDIYVATVNGINY